MTKISVTDFIIAIDQYHTASVLQMPVLNEENDWLREEMEYVGDGDYPKVKPGVYKASLHCESWKDYEGDWDSKSWFDDLEPIYIVPDRPIPTEAP